MYIHRLAEVSSINYVDNKLKEKEEKFTAVRKMYRRLSSLALELTVLLCVGGRSENVLFPSNLWVRRN